MRDKRTISRREFLAVGGLTLAGLQSAAGQQRKKKKMIDLYVGTYTTGTKSEGIYSFSFDPSNGRVKLRQVVKGVADPSYLTPSPDGRFVFAVNELMEFAGQPGGAVSSFARDSKTGDLTFLNQQATRGGAPCYITPSADGRFVLVANYMGGNFASFSVDSDGRLSPAVQVVQHQGFGPNKDRQEAAHAHSISLDRNNRYAFAADLGIDRMMIYSFDSKTGTFAPNKSQEFLATKPGAGPRHFDFHPSGRFAFLINELDFTISALAYDEKSGTLKELQTVPTLPAGASTTGVTCADIHVSPDGRFVYGSNRGHNSIAAYAFDDKSGALTLIGHTPTGGKKPRNFVISPDGKFLLVANQDSDNVVVFMRDQSSGKLSASGYSFPVPAPVCLKFI